MAWTGWFDPSSGTILLEVRLWGRLGQYLATFLLDTGSPVTVIAPGVLDALGYSARMGVATSALFGIDGAAQSGYRIVIDHLVAMGLTYSSVEVFCNDIQENLGFDGLIGMDLLHQCVVNIDMRNGSITVDPPPGSSGPPSCG